MKNKAESMPNQAPEPKKPDFSEEDIDRLVESFGESKRSEAERQEASASIENMIAETIAELDEKEKVRNVERTGIIYTEAAKAADGTLKESLNMALQMADTPEGAMLLVQPVQERLQKTLDPDGGFSKLHEDPKIQRLYKVFTDKILHEAVVAVKSALEKELESAIDPERISSLHKLLENVESADPGGDKG